MREKIPPINIDDLNEILYPVYQSKVPLLIIGHKGIGKSEVIKQFCIKKKLEFIDIRLAYLEAQDIIGFPYRDEKTNKMNFSPPEWLPTKGKGILFFDEINRARLDVLQAIFQLVRDREIGGIQLNNKRYKLPENWSIVSAMNPDSPDGQYFVTQLDESLYDRFLKVTLISDKSVFINYVQNNKDFCNEIKSFLKEEDFLLSDDILPDIEVDPTPRGFEMFNKIFKYIKDNDKLITIIGNGIIGQSNTKKFINFKNNFYKEIKELLENILYHWDKNENIKKIIENYKKNRIDIIIAIKDQFIDSYINNIENYFLIKKGNYLTNFIDYIFFLNDEMIVAYLISIKEGLKENQGLYLTDILSIIENNKQLKYKYDKINLINKKINLEDYI